MTTALKRTVSAKKPLVSIVIPVFNDEEYIARALDTSVNQSLRNIEIICVDDCSTDDTVKIIEKYVKKDPRVKLIQHKDNASAFQARRTGIEVARADYILFLDGDDELHKDAAKLSYKQAVKSGSDIVGFGSHIVRQDGSYSREFENLIQPAYTKLIGSNIVAKLFEPAKPAQGHMWRYLFSKKLLLKAYGYFPEGQRIYRVNDLPISFLSAALAKKYTSIKNRLYIYHFYAGGSGGANFTIEKFKFYTKGVESLNVLGSIINNGTFKNTTKEAYYSARLSVISNIIRQIENNLPTRVHEEAVNFLLTKVPLDELTFSMAHFIPEALNTVRNQLPLKQPDVQSKNIALYTNNLNTGGIQSVVISQAKYLQDAGFNVMIIVLNDKNITYKIPKGIHVESAGGRSFIHERLIDFQAILIKNKIDTIINHGILYNFSWPFFALVARNLNIATVAWSHNFSLRSLIEMSSNGKFINENVNLIDYLITLSKTDVSYWKSLGHKNVYYLPNPPSPLLLNSNSSIQPKKAPKDQVNLIWFGRLQQATKKVYSLIDIAAELKKLTGDFTLTIIGPDSSDLKASELKEQAKVRGLEAHIKVVGPKHGTKLIDELKKADVFVNTSIIEGYLLTLVEAQAFALPIVMYELPWLATVENNKGVLQTPQKDAKSAAQEIYNLYVNKQFYEEMSKNSLNASKDYLSHDFAKLYTQLLQHKLPKEFSPDIDIEHMGTFVKWTQFYFAELMESATFSGGINPKDAEIAALKNSIPMRLGNTLIKPARVARDAKRKLAKHLKNR